MEEAVLLAWNDPDAFRNGGDRRAVRRVVSGVTIEVQAYGPEFDRFRSAFPVNGNGVFKNLGDDHAEEFDLDVGVLDEKEWTRVVR